ncbi:MAG: DUF1467 family protein [Alphaproteobacteria bacterium]|nr:DUF1467 family protein [Alphaproteobacteria bacterium]
MPPLSAITVFIVLWWLVFFAVLPWGIRRDDAPQTGNDPGAPAKPNLLRKAMVTTAIAAVLFCGVYVVIAGGLLPNLRDVFERPV